MKENLINQTLKSFNSIFISESGPHFLKSICKTWLNAQWEWSLIDVVRSTSFCLILKLPLVLLLGHSWKRLNINPAIFPTYSERVDHEEMKILLSVIWKTSVKLSYFQQGMSDVLQRLSGSVMYLLFLPPPSPTPTSPQYVVVPSTSATLSAGQGVVRWYKFLSVDDCVLSASCI